MRANLFVLFTAVLAVTLSFQTAPAQDVGRDKVAVRGSASKVLSPEQIESWRADLKFIAKEYPLKHPNMFHRLDKGQFGEAIAKLDKKIPELTEHQIVLELARIVGMPRDGHSYLSTIWVPELEFQFHPIRFYVFSDGVYVTNVAQKHKAILGARLKAIEDMAIEDVIEKIGPYMSTDNEFGILESVPYYLASPSVLFALGISETPAQVTYKFEKDGKTFEFQAELDPAQDNSISAMLKDAPNWLDVRSESTKPLPLTYKHRDKRLSFEYLAEEKLIFVQMNSVLDDEDKTIEDFFGEVVEFTAKNDVKKLVLDLRHNGGGNNTLVRPIIRGLIQMKEIDRKGNLFVIIGRRTFSAAQNLVNQLETWTNASFIGEPTGSHVNMYGDARTFNLPKSGLRLRISELYWQNKHARDERRWTAPNVAAEPNFIDYKSNIDPAMKVIRNFESRPTLLELAMKRQANMDVAGFRLDAIQFKNDPANKYVDIEAQINRFGYNMIRAKQLDAALALFKINVELYPESWNVYDSLAEAYMLKGNHEEAIKLYTKSLEMNPANENAVQMLKRIRSQTQDPNKADH